jgi:hypothetical protein
VPALGYLAHNARDQGFAVIVLSEDPREPVQQSASVEIRALDDIAAASGLMGWSESTM